MIQRPRLLMSTRLTPCRVSVNTVDEKNNINSMPSVNKAAVENRTNSMSSVNTLTDEHKTKSVCHDCQCLVTINGRCTRYMPFVSVGRLTQRTWIRFLNVSVFDFHIHDQSFKSRTMGSSYVIILQTVIHWANVVISKTYKVSYGFFNGIFTIDLSPF